jgi:hypothetical protein
MEREVGRLLESQKKVQDKCFGFGAVRDERIRGRG